VNPGIGIGLVALFAVLCIVTDGGRWETEPGVIYVTEDDLNGASFTVVDGCGWLWDERALEHLDWFPLGRPYDWALDGA
jgi:hypothetical protein